MLPTPDAKLISPADLEHELMLLFGAGKNTDLVVRVQGADLEQDRNDAFQELLRSLTLYNPEAIDAQRLTVPLPDQHTITRALLVLADKSLQHRLFEHILSTFGHRLIDPLAAILDSARGGPLFNRMVDLRHQLLSGVEELRLTQETRGMLEADLRKLLDDSYLALLAEHEETNQRPRVKRLAQEVLHLVGVTFQRAFARWPEHAERIALCVSRGFNGSVGGVSGIGSGGGRIGHVELGEHPVFIRRRIVQAIAEFLWVETSSDLSGALTQLFAQRAYSGLVEHSQIDLDRSVYDEFAEACWQLVAERC
ncbi:MAG: hypothetical protein QM756_04205 [Polyangiaceae bacterium]